MFNKHKTYDVDSSGRERPWQKSTVVKKTRWFIYYFAIFVLDLAEYSRHHLIADAAKLFHRWLENHPPN